jgi:hypothetical protein
MKGPQTFSGVGTVFCADGKPLDGQRRYSFTLLPYDVPAFARPLDGRGATRPGSMACWVELRGREPLELEGEKLRLQMADGRWIRFHVFDVSVTPPHLHTTIVEGWPEVAAEAIGPFGEPAGLRHRA